MKTYYEYEEIEFPAVTRTQRQYDILQKSVLSYFWKNSSILSSRSDEQGVRKL